MHKKRAYFFFPKEGNLEEKKVPQNNVFKLETTFTIYRANLDTIRICRESRYISFYSHFYLIS